MVKRRMPSSGNCIGPSVDGRWRRSNLFADVGSLSRSDDKSACDAILPEPSQPISTSFTFTVSTICSDRQLAIPAGEKEYLT